MEINKVKETSQSIKKTDSRPSPRLATMSEPDANEVIRAGVIKSLTGGDGIKELPNKTNINNKVKETFRHIRENWKPEYYLTCLEEWEKLQTFISIEKTDYQCKNCKTYWTTNKFIFDVSVCCKCDTHVQPYLSNPINHQYVLEYIDPKYYRTIFKIYRDFEEIKHQDPYDIFKKTYFDNQILNQYVALKFETEYGTIAEVRSVFEELYIKMMIVDGKSEYNTSGLDYPFYLTSFTIGEEGLSEKIFSNRIEYYLNGHYFGNQTDPITEKLMERVNYQFQKEKFYPRLLAFVESDDDFQIIPRTEFEKEIDLDCGDIPECQNCAKKMISESDNICDFCNRCYCDSCMPDEYSFHKCDTCGKRWCYYDGRHIDYRCEKTNFISGDCWDCGL